MAKTKHRRMPLIKSLCRIGGLPKKLLADLRYADCSFLVGTIGTKRKIISAHKCILATASPVFEAMLYGSLSGQNFPIPIPDITPSGFQAMVDCIYKGYVKLYKMDDLCQLWVASHKYQIEEIFNRCAKEISNLITIDNVCTVLDYAMVFENIEVERACLEMISYHARRLFTAHSFQEVTPQVLNKILSMNILSIQEIDIFVGLENWAKEQCTRQNLEINTDNLRKVSQGALEKVRFLAMSARQFTTGPGISLMLSKDEKFAILMSLPDRPNAGNLLPFPQLSKEWRSRRDLYDEHHYRNMQDSFSKEESEMEVKVD